MVEFLSDSKDLDNARAALLKYYSSECMAHGTYIITVAIGLFGFVQVLPVIMPLEILQRVVLLGLISSILATLTVHILGRALFWGYLASEILRVVPKKESEIKSEEGTTATSLQLLHQACAEHVRRKHRIIGEFHRARIWEIELWLIFFIGFSLILLTLNL